MRIRGVILLAAALCACFTLDASGADAGKRGLLASIDDRAAEYWSCALDIWSWSEPGYQEPKSSARLQQLLSEAGFEIQAGVAGMPTAFVASFASSERVPEEPVIGILAEFDALPGLSQEAVPFRSPRAETRWGHACGHHLLGTASVAAAIALSERLAAGELRGEIRLYGTPAEEGGGAKVFMVREGLFADVDAVLHWHPSSDNAAGDPTNQARIAAKFRFKGRSAHAAAAPEQGRSALDAIALTNHCAELLREHTPDLTRLHHIITAGGDAPNVVPEHAEGYYYVRHPDPAVARSVYDRLLLCAEGAATGTETELFVEYLGGIYNVLPNDTLARVSLRNLRALPPIEYSPEETEWALQLQETLADPKPLESVARVLDRSGMVSRGSTDVGDVSWVVPTSGVRTATWVPGTPAHSWQAVAAGGMSIGRKGMLQAARALAATAWDLYQEPSVLEEAKRELAKRTAMSEYRAMLDAGQEPPLDYRGRAD